MYMLHNIEITVSENLSLPPLNVLTTMNAFVG